MTDGVHSPYQMCIFGKKLSSCLHYKQGLDKRFKSVLFLSLSLRRSSPLQRRVMLKGLRVYIYVAIRPDEPLYWNRFSTLVFWHGHVALLWVPFQPLVGADPRVSISSLGWVTQTCLNSLKPIWSKAFGGYPTYELVPPKAFVLL